MRQIYAKQYLDISLINYFPNFTEVNRKSTVNVSNLCLIYYKCTVFGERRRVNTGFHDVVHCQYSFYSALAVVTVAVALMAVPHPNLLLYANTFIC